MAKVKAPLVLNALDRVNGTVRIQLRGHFDVVDRTDHHSVTGDGGTFTDFNACSF